MGELLMSLKNLFSGFPLYIHGDFSVDLNKASKSLKFLEVFEQNNVCQIVDENTRINNRSQTMIDLIFTNFICKCL